MNLDLTNKHAIVCGSTQGIGKAVAMELARMGANVVLVARNIDNLTATKSELDTSKGQLHNVICADFSFPEDLKIKMEQYITMHKEVDILVNNTGGPSGGPIVDAKTEDFIKTFSNHLLCNHILVQSVVESMKNKGSGRIINIISTSVKQPLKGLGVSNTIRAAVANWAKTLSLELAPFGITVNNVLPGATNTVRLSSLLQAKALKTGHSIEFLKDEMIKEIPAGRFAEAHEIANAVAFLASPAAAYINGVNIPVDGGRTGCL
ncbi:MAG: SDR family oxidoreductase [Bacteroidetes bacterium]|nr:SDR family oxidoreductase [Bacteroidota bacterium]HET6245566.1 SDR family oxidoreductase [Bacteroidia bacterium]